MKDITDKNKKQTVEIIDLYKEKNSFEFEVGILKNSETQNKKRIERLENELKDAKLAGDP